ncbi:hypothetical protein G4B88_025644, partial [Cannabis sativa]
SHNISFQLLPLEKLLFLDLENLSVKLQKKTEKEQKSCPILTDMDKIFIVIQHSGHWDENQNYINFQVRGMVIPNNCNYNTLVGMICNELKIDLGSTTLKIEYQGKDNYPPFHIEDDLQFYFYKELKKKDSDFTKYPLCLTMENNHIESTVFPTRSTSTEINHIELTFFSTRSTSTYNELGIELGQAEEGTSNSDEEATVDMDADESENYISNARLVAKQIIEMGNEANNDAEEIKIDEDSVINNKNHQEIAPSQIYKEWSCKNRNIAQAIPTRLTSKHEEILNDNYKYSLKMTV